MNNDDPSAVNEPTERYSQIILARAAPLFDQVAHAARHAGLHAEVHASGNPIELCLQVKDSEHGHASHYLIQFDSHTRCVQHQLFLADTGTTQKLAGGIDSVNGMVLDTQLATLFREAFNLTLPTVEERHPAGFW